jgi:hypothetical protein
MESGVMLTDLLAAHSPPLCDLNPLVVLSSEIYIYTPSPDKISSKQGKERSFCFYSRPPTKYDAKMIKNRT